MTDLQELRDREDLRETALNFALAVDNVDMTLYRAVFADACEYDLSSFNGQPPVTVKAADWAAGIEPFLRGFDATQHILSNFGFEIAGDAAVVTAYVQAEHFRSNSAGDDSVTMGGHYRFRMIRTSGGWRINGFKLTAAWHRGNQGLYTLAGDGAPRR
ncbi:nuclear transport factor 2 family protein [Emcibacter sp. SYSU 3D8]|uniref:nuclear transport factor 2 family protein n=1 Tax=Emcibacter sp. SYSU 3D8 TaxID=3133969 RepID=UPI0031FE6466